MHNVNITVKVVDLSEPRTVKTKNGEATIREATVEDDTGKAKLTLWGKQAEAVRKGSVIKIENAWTTSFKGEVKLNVGDRSKISQVEEGEEQQTQEEEPEETPSYRKKQFKGRKHQYRRPRYDEDEE